MIEIHLVRVNYGEYEDYVEKTLMVLAIKERAEDICNQLKNIMDNHREAIRKWKGKNPKPLDNCWEAEGSSYCKRIAKIHNRFINKINKILPKEYYFSKIDGWLGPFSGETPNFFIESHKVYH